MNYYRYSRNKNKNIIGAYAPTENKNFNNESLDDLDLLMADAMLESVKKKIQFTRENQPKLSWQRKHR